MLNPLLPEDAQRFREFVVETGYTDDGFQKRPALRELPSRRSGNLTYLLEATREPTALNILVRLFLFDLAVDGESARNAIPASILKLMLDSGMVRASGGRLSADVMLTPLDDFLFAADPVTRMESGEASNSVLWPNQTTRILHLSAIQRPCSSTLDLGAGCGVIAVLAAGRSGQIVATDINPRARDFARFNASLNGVGNIETVTGDTFTPVADRTFDHILANPPFFVTPSSDLLYCENPMELDQYCRRVVREGSAHLNEGGHLQMVFEWVQVRGESWQERLAEWLEGTGCDAWILRTYVGEAARYAYERTKTQHGLTPQQADEQFERCVEYYRRRDVEQVQGGILAMRRRSGTNWLRIEEGRMEPAEPFGDRILDLFDTQTVLSTHLPDEELLALKPALAPGLRLDQQLRPEDGRWILSSAKLSVGGALPVSMNTESQVAQFLTGCDGTRTLDELARALAGVVRAPLEQVREQCSSVVRKLAERRLIVLRPLSTAVAE
jgi:methylase of polypeptide subunit release factors